MNDEKINVNKANKNHITRFDFVYKNKFYKHIKCVIKNKIIKINISEI